MKNRILFSFLTLLSVTFLAGLNGCSSDDDESGSMIITNITPDTGTANTQVTINGEGFGATIADNVVKFNGVEATQLVASTTQIIASVPSGAGTGNVTVTVGSTTINGPVFTYEEPPSNSPFYISFKANGAAKLFEDGNPGYQACGDCSCSFIPALDDSRNAGVTICQLNTVTATMIENLKNKIIPFKDDSFPIANFGYTENGVSYHTDYVDQGSYTVNITNVVSDGLFGGKKVYKVTGTFECKVAKSDGSSVTTITDGSFVVRYTEDF